MEFVVANPFFLQLLPLAALPVVFHLFARIRRKTLIFSTFMFFHRIDPLLNARRTIRQWLLLMMRVLVIVLLLLALARPLVVGSGSGGKTAAVLIIDNSGSMNTTGASKGTKQEEAIAAAEAVIASLNKGDSAALVLLVDDPAVPLPNGFSSDLAMIKSALRQILPTEATGAPGKALERAFALIRPAPAAHYEVLVFSDLQETEWGKLSAASWQTRPGTTIQFHRITTRRRNEPNVSIAGILIPEKRFIAGRHYRSGVRLRNTSGLKADIRLNTEDDQGSTKVEPVQVTAREEKIVPLDLNAETAGVHWKNVWIEGDGFIPDNRAALALECSAQMLVLFIGTPEEFGVLPVAMAPSGDGSLSGLSPVFARPTDCEGMLSTNQPVLVVLTWAGIERKTLSPKVWKTLERYVNDGGNCLIVPSIPDPVAAITPGWIGLAADDIQAATAGVPVMIFQKEALIFDDLRDNGGRVLFRDVRAFKFQPLRVADDTIVLAGLENGSPLLAEQRRGRGSIFASGLAFDTLWSNLPLKAGFLAIAQNMALGAHGRMDRVTTLTAGNKIAEPVHGKNPVRIRSVTSSFPVDWKASAADRPVLPRAGVYTLEDGTNLAYVAVSASADEAQEAFVTSQNIPAAAGLTYSVKSYEGADNLIAMLKRSRSGIDFYPPLVLACLLAVLMEGWLATFPPHGTREQLRLPRGGVKI